MRRVRVPTFLGRTQGQSMLETALMLPILLLIAFNAINFGYFFFVAVNLAAAPRSGVQYSIIGPSTPKQPMWAPPGLVSALTYEDMQQVWTIRGGVAVNTSDARVQVCTRFLGSDAATRSKALCCETSASGGACTPNGNSADQDPETEWDSTAGAWKVRFFRHKVDVFYELGPVIPSFTLPTPAGPIPLTILPTITMHRQVTMRNM